MSTPLKKYQNVSYAELMSFASKNPNRNRTLDPIEIHIPKHKEETTLENLGLKGYIASNMNPSGILSVISCISDPEYYSLSQKNVRTQMLIDLSTSLQQKTDELKNTHLSRKRKKIYELIAAAYNGSIFKDDSDYLELYHGIAYMNQTQFILMKEAVQEKTEDDTKVQESSLKGTIVFSSNPMLWKKEYPIWIADYKGRWVAIPSDPSAISLHDMLDDWLKSIEQLGWIVEWHAVEGTKVEIVEKLSVLPSWNENDRKQLKEILAVRLGKEQSLRLFTSWKTSTHNLL